MILRWSYNIAGVDLCPATLSRLPYFLSEPQLLSRWLP
jgi:hypothetical protein